MKNRYGRGEEEELLTNMTAILITAIPHRVLLPPAPTVVSRV